MTEEEARTRTAVIAGPAMPIVERYAALLLAENRRQNLIARTTEPAIWSRHLLDSIQLARFARDADRTWVDVGSGPGLPGLVLASLGHWSMTLVEPRRRRAEFLVQVVEELGLTNVAVVIGDVQGFGTRQDLISARAVAKIDVLFGLTRRCGDTRSRYILPKGRAASADMDIAAKRWHGSFHVEHSITDDQAGIVIADGVKAR